MHTLFHDLDMPPVHTFGGINMSFFGLGSLARRSGAIFIRRSFDDDQVYKSVFAQYTDYLVEKRFPLLWALEGTRSRTGKLMPPRYGLIRYVVDSYLRNVSNDLVLVPVSIVYDQVPEVKDYAQLQSGASKQRESTSWFMKYISGLKNTFGKIHVRFGQGVALSEVVGEAGPATTVSKLDLQKIAFQLSVEANRVTPVTTTSLVTYVLLTQGHKALTFQELAAELRPLHALLRKLDCPTTVDVDVATPEVLARVLDQLSHNGEIVAFHDGPEAVYGVAPAASRTYAYYRNGLIHFLVAGAIDDLALLHVAEQNKGDKSLAECVDMLHDEALRLRDLLKFEFFFDEKEAFITVLEKELSLRAPQWRERLWRGGEAVLQLLSEMEPLLAHGTLRPFVESYQVVAEALMMELTSERASGSGLVEPQTLVKKCLSLGRQRVLQQRLNSEESVSQTYFDNGIKLAESRGIFADSNMTRVENVSALARELSELTRRIGFLASMAENRRKGETSPFREAAADYPPVMHRQALI